MVEKQGIKYYLDDLPIRKDGKIDWINSIGHVIKFEHQDLKDSILIESVDKSGKNTYVTIRYKNKTKRMISSSVKDCSGFRKLILGENLRNVKKVGDIIEKYKRRFVVVDVSLKTIDDGSEEGKIRPYYKLKCLTCGNEITVDTIHLHKPTCRVCANLDVMPGFNDVATTDPWMIPFFEGDEATKYVAGSSKKIYPICPHCGKKHNKQITIALLKAHKGFRCDYCNDNIPYPEKVVMEIFNQLGIKYYHEAGDDILPFKTYGKRYDFYIPSLSCIIETHGRQHYSNTLFGCRLVKAKEVQENDKYKQNLAEGVIKHYIVIDCRVSELYYIKKSILETELYSILGICENDVDWMKCERHSCNPLTKTICEDYVANYLTVEALCKKYNRCPATIQEILYTGTNLGWCVFNKNVNANKKPVELLIGDTHLRYGISITNLSEILKREINPNAFSQSYMSRCFRNNQLLYGKYILRYVEDIPTRWDILNGKYDNELIAEGVV